MALAQDINRQCWRRNALQKYLIDEEASVLVAHMCGLLFFTLARDMKRGEKSAYDKMGYLHS